MRTRGINGIFVFITLLFAIFIIISLPLTSATSVNRVALTNLEGYPGDVIVVNMTLTGTLPDQTGHWRTSYKNISNDERMDLRSQITITPENYTLKRNEIKEFIVKVKIPANAEPGLVGAISEDAGMPGHSAQRRTYIIFEDANTTAVKEAKGSVAYSGLLIPLSVKVLGKPVKPSPLAEIAEAIKSNIMIIALLAIIFALLLILLRRRR